MELVVLPLTWPLAVVFPLCAVVVSVVEVLAPVVPVWPLAVVLVLPVVLPVWPLAVVVVPV